MPRKQKPLAFSGYGQLLQPEFDNFLRAWKQTGKPAPPEREGYFLTHAAAAPETFATPETLATFRRLMEPGQRRPAQRPRNPYAGQPPYFGALHLAAMYAEFPDFTAAWLHHARQLLTDRSQTSQVARRWLLLNTFTAHPDRPEKEKLAVANLQFGEIRRAIRRDTGVEVSEATLRRERDRLIAEDRERTAKAQRLIDEAKASAAAANPPPSTPKTKRSKHCQR